MHPPLRHLLPSGAIPRHLHAAPYAAVVLEGGYEEAGERGRWRVQPGDVLVHGAFSAHWNPAPGRRVVVLNLPLAEAPDAAVARATDPDALARLAERDPAAAASLLVRTWSPGRPPLDDAPDRMATALSELGNQGIEAWAAAHGVARATAFRWFRQAYGVGPARYRVEARARRAWRMVMDAAASLADIAAETGFSDQAHMSRDIQALTGRPPGAWRRLQHPFKTAAA